MAAIRKALILEDKFTSAMTQCLQVVQRMVNMLDDVRTSTMNAGTVAAATAVQMRELAGKMTQTNSQGTSLSGTIRNLAGIFLGMQFVRWLVDTSDQLTSINARLWLMTGSAEAAAAAQEEIYQAAMRNRGAYVDMTDFVSQFGTVAGSAFTGTDELVAFAEQIQKQMAISGVSGMSVQAALVQFIQGLASGTLRGEEFSSVLERTPTIAQTIAEYTGVTTGEMRELTSEGKVTAEAVKNAMLGVAKETNAQSERTSMTWAQVRTTSQNVAIQALDPVLDATSWLANNIGLVGLIILGLGATLDVFLLVANWVNICTAATMALTTVQEMPRAVMATIWGLSPIIIAPVIGAIYAVTAAVNHFAETSVPVTGIIAGVVFTVAVIIGNTITGLLNGIIQAVWSIFVTPFLGIIEWVLDVTNGGFDLFGGAAANLIGNITPWSLDLDKAVTKITDAILGTSWTAGFTSLQDSVLKWGKNESAITLDRNASTIDYRFNYGGAWSTGYNWGVNLFSGNGNDAVGAALSGVPYDELSGQLGDIAGSVGSIEKPVKISDEDIKSPVGVAERRYVDSINPAAQTSVITISGANTGRTAADRRSLANAIRDILTEQTASDFTHSTAWPAGG